MSLTEMIISNTLQTDFLPTKTFEVNKSKKLKQSEAKNPCLFRLFDTLDPNRLLRLISVIFSG